MCYGICTAESDDDAELVKQEGQTDEEEEDAEDDVRWQLPVQLQGPGKCDKLEEELEEKGAAEKKLD